MVNLLDVARKYSGQVIEVIEITKYHVVRDGKGLDVLIEDDNKIIAGPEGTADRLLPNYVEPKHVKTFVLAENPV